jgi:hypothetical protein
MSSSAGVYCFCFFFLSLVLDVKHRHAFSDAHSRRGRHSKRTHKSSSPTSPEPPTDSSLSRSAVVPPSSAIPSKYTGVSKWKSIRPWLAPASIFARGDHEDGEWDESSECCLPTPTQHGHGRFQLQIVDVSSTAVSFAVVDSCDSSIAPVSDSNRSREAPSSKAPAAPNTPISISLDSNPWPHVFHSESALSESAAKSGNGAMIVVYGLEPGRDYEVQLDAGVCQKSREPALYFFATSHGLMGCFVSGTSVSGESAAHDHYADDTSELDTPPPPYSSHDPHHGPSSPSHEEIELRSRIKKFRVSAKHTEASINASVAALRRSLDKAGREDQRTKQRISMLEDGAQRATEAARVDEDEEANILRLLPELEEEESAMARKVERHKAQLEDSEREYRQGLEDDEASLRALRLELDALVGREEGLVSERHRYERDVLPDLNIRLANLEAELRRLSEEERSHEPLVPPALRSMSLRHPRRPPPPNVHTMPNNAPHAGGGGPTAPPAPLGTDLHPSERQQQQQRSRRFSFGHVHAPPAAVVGRHPYEARAHPAASASTPAFGSELRGRSGSITAAAAPVANADPTVPTTTAAAASSGRGVRKGDGDSWASKVMGQRRRIQQA